MKYLVTPWREKYITDEIDKGGCFLCEASKAERPEDKHILYKGEYSFIIMNLYPYNSGHLLIAPYEHIETPVKADKKIMDEINSLMIKTLKILEKVYSPQGFNIGMNLGRAAGAGVPGHFHLHIVPRWEGDSNFMPIFSDTKVMFEGVEKSYKKLKKYFKK